MGNGGGKKILALVATRNAEVQKRWDQSSGTCTLKQYTPGSAKKSHWCSKSGTQPRHISCRAVRGEQFLNFVICVQAFKRGAVGVIVLNPSGGIGQQAQGVLGVGAGLL